MPRPPAGERDIAVHILLEVTENAAYANIALRQVLSAHPGLDPRGRAFVTELTNGVLRNLLRIDHILGHFSKTPVEKMKPFIRAVLRTAVYQLRFMDRVPPSAAVNEAVRMTKGRGLQPLAGFVNAVLRSVARQPDAPALPEAEADPVGYIGLAYSYPPWLASYLAACLGVPRALAFCRHSHTPPPVTVFTNGLKTTPEQLASRLQSEGAACQPGAWYTACLHLRHTADIAALPSFRAGHFHVMDEGALAAVMALDPKPGQRVLDLCAAPGGKSFACAVLMGGHGEVTAYDIHPHRLALMKETAARLGVSCVTMAEGDASRPDPALIGCADAVLLDAPCSGLGILRKHPDIKYTRQPQDITDLAARQRAMLATAAAYVKPGGTLVYCVCTVTREEGDEVVRWFVERHPFTPEAPPSIADALTEAYGIQLLPGPYNDGFFIAKLRRKG